MKIPKNANEWSYELVLKLVNDGFFESEWFDFKEQLSQNLDQTASAFANTGGGFLVFGIKDNKNLEPKARIVGIDPSLDLPRLFGDKIEMVDPHIHYIFRNPPIKIPNNSRVIHVIHISASEDGPHISSDSRFRYRTNKGNQIMTRQQIRESFLKQDKVFVQKSSHFRYALNEQILNFMEGIMMRLDPDYDELDLDFFSEGKREKSIQSLKEFIDKNVDELYSILLQIPMVNFFKFESDYKDFAEEVKRVERFQSDNLFPEEQDAFVILKERMSSIGENGFDVRHFFEYHHVKNNNGTYEDMMNSSDNQNLFRNFLKRTIREIQDLTEVMIRIEETWNNLRKKYGDLAFKAYL